MERPVECVLVASVTGGVETQGQTLAQFAAGTANVGELGIFNADTNVASLAAGIPARHYYAVKVAAGEIRKSPTFSSAPTYLASAAASAGSAGTSTISNFTGDCETEYILKVRLESEKIFQTYGYQDLVKTYSYVTRCCSDACGCPDGAAWDVAMGIAEQVNDDRENVVISPSDYTMGVAKVLNSTDDVPANDPVNVWTLVKGSNVINSAGVITYGSGTVVVAGDFIRIMDGGGTVTPAAGDTFRVEAADATAQTITLDRPWPGASQDLDTTGDAEVIPKATGESYADSTWSIEIAGGAHATPAVGAFSAIAGTFNSNFVTAHIGLLGGFDCNGTVTSTAPVMPYGQAWQVSQLELKFGKNAIGSGNRPSPYRTPFPLSNLNTNESLTVSTDTYRVLSITYANGHESAGTIVKSPYVVRLCLADGAATTYTDVVNTAMAAGWNGIAGSINADGVILQM